MDTDVEAVLQYCETCQALGNKTNYQPLQPNEMPGGPWQYLYADLCGPFPTGEYVFVVIDAYSRYPEAVLMNSTTSRKLIEELEYIFARHGLPEVLKTDNAPNLVSEEMERFLRRNAVDHDRSTPYWPRSNGEVERFNRTMLKHFRAAYAEGKDWRTTLPQILLEYRSTKHAVTDQTPSMLMFNREIKNRLPSFPDKPQSKPHRDAREKDAINKRKMKVRFDEKMKVSVSDIKTGDRVLVRQKKKNKLSSKYKRSPYVVTERLGSTLKLRGEGGDEKMRNIADVTKLKSSTRLARAAMPRDSERGACDNWEDDDDFPVTIPDVEAVQPQPANVERDQQEEQVGEDVERHGAV